MAFESLKPLTLEPIGIYHGPQSFKQSSPRQSTLSTGAQQGFIELLPQKNFEQALEDLEGFSHVWVLFHFHHNQNWKPKVDPPISDGAKKGLFATRSPYRPNPIGISAVPLLKIEDRTLYLGPNDLLDQTPILDIKPYLAYADSIPQASLGWTNLETPIFEIKLSSKVEEQLQFLEDHGQNFLRPTLLTQLKFEPLNFKKKRVQILEGHEEKTVAELAARTWRIRFEADPLRFQIEVTSIRTGYTDQKLISDEDIYADKDIHRKFQNKYRGDQ